jgi:hypothetical protein
MDDVFLGVQTALVLAGAVLAARGLRRGWQGIRMPVRQPGKVLVFFRGFRMSVIGLALAAISAGWVFEQTWLIVLAAAIGFEETLESSIDIFALTKGKDLRLGPASRTTGR